MSKLTKLQLANENQTLRADLSRALNDIEILKTRGTRPVYVMPDWQINRLAAMTMARDMAVRTHSTIKVQS